MRMFNRERGSLVTPESQTSSTIEWGYGSSSYETQILDRWYRFTQDVKAKYGEGKWPYRPLHSEKLHTQDASYNYVGSSCPEAGSGDPSVYWGSAPVRAPAEYQGISTELGEEPSILGRLGGRVESRLPSLRPDLDLAVFLVEIRDIKDTLNLLAIKGKDILDSLANLDLWYNFAVAPMKGEIKGIAKMLIEFDHKYNDLLLGVGKIHDLKTTLRSNGDVAWTLVEPAAYTPCGRTDICPNGLVPGFYERSSKEVYYSATVKYRYSLPPRTIGDGLARLAAQAGVLPTWETGWELVPFSFVVDWVFNTKRLAEALGFDELGYDFKTEIIDCCVTRRIEQRTERCWVRPCIGPGGLGRGIAVRESTVLDRWVGGEAYSMLSGPWLKLPGFMQLHLGASLIRKLR